MKKDACNRAILQALADAAGAPLPPDQLVTNIYGGGSHAEQITRQAVELVTLKFVENVRPGGARIPLYRLTAAGQQQIDRTAKELSPDVWGDLAY